MSDLISRQDVPDTNVGNMISRKDAIDLVKDVCGAIMSGCDSHYDSETGDEVYNDIREVNAILKCNKEIRIALANMPSAQLDRDIPKKPREIMDTSWSIHTKQAVCPKCDYYLGYVSFLGGRKGKKITYCETCGQAIDWEGWDFDD